MSQLGHSRPSCLARKATYDRSCLKPDIRRAPTRLVLETQVAERLPGGVPHDEARIVVLIDYPRRREAARGGHGAASSTVAVWRRGQRRGKSTTLLVLRSVLRATAIGNSEKPLLNL
jgi:hypothetical protein